MTTILSKTMSRNVKFEHYKNYVAFRVLREEHGYTMLRAGLELVEEYLEYTLDPSIDELGDMFFWFTYLSWCMNYEIDWGKRSSDPRTLMTVTKDIAGCIKRIYRDSSLKKIDELKSQHLPTLDHHLQYLIYDVWETSIDNLIDSNIAKLDERFGNTYDG